MKLRHNGSVVTRGRIISSILIFGIATMFLLFQGSQKNYTVTRVSMDDSMKEIIDRLDRIEKHSLEQHAYAEYKLYRDKMKLVLPKIIKGANQNVNPHVLVDYVEKDHSKTYKVLIMVSSNIPHSDRRSLIRKVWGNKSNWVTKHDWKIVFVTGGTTDGSLLNRTSVEAAQYKDIIIEDIPESFYSLSKKVMIGFQWAHSNINYDYILKCDDDIFIQIDRVMNLIERTPGVSYMGQVMKAQPVMRKGRYGLTKDEHENDRFDPYCSGGAFLISFDTVNKILPLFDWDKPLKIDDAYLGHLVHKSGAKHQHQVGFFMWNRWCEYNKQLLISHPVKRHDCMHFLMARSMIDNNKLVNKTLENQRYAYGDEDRKKM